MGDWRIGTLALILAAGASASPEGDPCVVVRTAKGAWCAPCKRELAPDDMRKGLCKRCEEPPLDMEYCVKRSYLFRSACRHRKVSPRPFRCCAKAWVQPEIQEDRGRITHHCKDCDARAMVRSHLEHRDGCSNSFAVQKLCAKSGKEPHSGR
jgi:hypothetical protein